MQKTRSEQLIDKLINSTLTPEELEELLDGMKNQNTENEYTEILKKFFEELMKKTDSSDI